MKGYKTELQTVPSIVYYQSPTADTFEAESPLTILFYNGSIDIIQGTNAVNISDDYLEDFIKTLKEGRKESLKYLR